MTMASIDSAPKRVDDPGLPNKRRVRRERKPRSGGKPSKASSSASAAVQSTARGSILWTLLLAGLVFSMIDIFYIANYLERTTTIQVSDPIIKPSVFLIPSGIDSPKDDHPHPYPGSSSDTEHPTTGQSLEKPIDDSKDQVKAKGPIQISTPIRNPSKSLSTKDANSRKFNHPDPQPEESSSHHGEHTTTGHTVDMPKDDGKYQDNVSIQSSNLIGNSSALLSTNDNMDSPKDEHTNPEESSVEHEENTTTGHTVEKTKDDSKDQDKGPILLLLKEAGIDLDDLEQTVIDSLPLWSTVVKLYGDKPRIVGLDTCEAFQATGDPADHFLGVAGTFNTGTNLMSELFIANCHMPARMAKYGKVNRGIRWQVPWGKHTPVADDTLRLNHKTEKDLGVDPNSVFPAVTVRDPAAWMQSMCRHEYAMKWPHNKTVHCPNLVPNGASDFMNSPLKQVTNSSVPVTVQYKGFTKTHDSLLHHWNEYYAAYTATATFPHVVVRFEDLIFHPVAVTTAVCECAGGAVNREFKYVTGSAKKGIAHGKEKTGYIDAIIRYGNDRGDRWKGMTEADLTYTRENLDPTLMALFGYHYPAAPTTTRI